MSPRWGGGGWWGTHCSTNPTTPLPGPEGAPGRESASQATRGHMGSRGGHGVAVERLSGRVGDAGGVLLRPRRYRAQRGQGRRLHGPAPLEGAAQQRVQVAEDGLAADDEHPGVHDGVEGVEAERHQVAAVVGERAHGVDEARDLRKGRRALENVITITCLNDIHTRSDDTNTNTW